MYIIRVVGEEEKKIKEAKKFKKNARLQFKLFMPSLIEHTL